MGAMGRKGRMSWRVAWLLGAVLALLLLPLSLLPLGGLDSTERGGEAQMAAPGALLLEQPPRVGPAPLSRGKALALFIVAAVLLQVPARAPLRTPSPPLPRGRRRPAQYSKLQLEGG